MKNFSSEKMSLKKLKVSNYQRKKYFPLIKLAHLSTNLRILHFPSSLLVAKYLSNHLGSAKNGFSIKFHIDLEVQFFSNSKFFDEKT